MSERRRRRRSGSRRLRRRVDQLAPRDDWVYFGDYRMFVVGYTPGGAPYGTVEGLAGDEYACGVQGQDDELF